jgi:predicted DNA binding CopG/RHH family protein
MKKKIPIFDGDEEAERFVETADLSEYDLSRFRPVRFEFEAKSGAGEHAPAEASARCREGTGEAAGHPYTRFIREVLEREISRPDKLR